jgi:hypothetical protein
MVAGVEPGQGPQWPGEAGEVVEVDQPLILAVAEGVPQGSVANVGDPADDQRRQVRRQKDRARR